MDQDMNQECNQDFSRATQTYESTSESSGTSRDVVGRVTEKFGQAKQTADDLRRTAVNKVEAQREPTAGALNQAADTLHEQTDNITRKAANAGHATADTLERVAGYIRYHDTNAMVDDVRGLVRRYPGQFLAGAAAIGFLIGRVLRRDSY